MPIFLWYPSMSKREIIFSSIVYTNVGSSCSTFLAFFLIIYVINKLIS